MEQCKLIKLAMLGNREAAKRLTDAGVLVPCPWCGAEERDIRSSNSFWCWCRKCNLAGPIRKTEQEARLAWNTRAPILSESEMEVLDAKD